MSIPPVPSSSNDPAMDPSWLAAADPDTLRTAVLRLCTRLETLEQQNAALEYAAESFGALADRLNDALRAMRRIPPVTPHD